MAAPATSSDFLELVRKSNLLEVKRLDAYLDRLRTDNALPEEPGPLADALIQGGLLTNFQAECLLQGRWRRFALGKYKVLERLGSGGMGSVYLCEHTLMRRRVAIKVLPENSSRDPASLERFYREARAVAALDHPNIVKAYDIDQDQSLHFLVMEHVDGSNLQDVVAVSGPLEPVRAAHYVRQAALGLDHAHQKGLVHRDVKPGNLLLDRTGVVKVLDLGLARFFHDDADNLTRKFEEHVLGTADYVAPEQAQDSHDVDIRADIYGLGATFYYLLTGHTVFPEGTVAQKLIWHQIKKPKPVTADRTDVPHELLAVLETMMAKLPAERYQTPAEVALALAPWTQTPIPPPSEKEMPRFSPAATGPVPADERTVISATPPGSSGIRKRWEVSGPSGSKILTAPVVSDDADAGPRRRAAYARGDPAGRKAGEGRAGWRPDRPHAGQRGHRRVHGPGGHGTYGCPENAPARRPQAGPRRAA
jgi:serine/threonine protein kinase